MKKDEFLKLQSNFSFEPKLLKYSKNTFLVTDNTQFNNPVVSNIVSLSNIYNAKKRNEMTSLYKDIINRASHLLQK